MNDEYYMRLAIKEARKAVTKGEWPVGCVIEYEEKIISSAHNLSHLSSYKLAHAEIIALRKADKVLRNNYHKATLYTTFQPCPMCFGAAIVYKIKRIVSGCDANNSGGFCLFEHLPKYYQQDKFKIKTTTGILEKECLELFFKNYPKKSQK